MTVLLERTYGPRPWEPYGDPLSGLIETILSQHTNDANSGAAFDELRRQFPNWREVLRAPLEKVERAVRCGGLARQKAQRIQTILRAIETEHGSLDLDFLADWPVERAMEYLCRFKGVGPKTAACVLMFNLGKPVLPVDTHIHRVSKRLGLVLPKVSAATCQEQLQRVCPEDLVWPFHVLMITHGRRTCKSQRPLCRSCCLRRMCPIGRSLGGRVIGRPSRRARVGAVRRKQPQRRDVI